MASEGSAPQPRLAGRLVRNAFFNTAEWTVAVLLSVLATPFMVRRLTDEGFGVYVVLTGLAGYSAILDLGLGQSLVKLVAEYQATNRREEVSDVLNAAFCVQILSGIAVGLLVAFNRDAILRWLSVPPSLLLSAKRGLMAATVAFFFVLVSGTLSSAVQGLQRYDITSRVNSASNIVLTTTVVIILVLGGGLAALVYATAVCWALIFAVYFRIVRRLLPDWKPGVKLPTELIAQMFDTRASQSFVIFVMRFILSAMLGPAAVTIYSVPLRIIVAFGGFLASASISLFPLASELSAQGAIDRLRGIYLRASKYFVSLALPAFSVMGLLSHPILALWMGQEFAEKAARTMTILCFGTAVGSTGSLSGMVVLGIGRSRLLAAFSLVSMAIGAFVGISLVPAMGVAGAAVAYSAAGAVWLVFQCYVARAIFGLGLGTYLSSVYRFHALALAPFLCATVLLTARWQRNAIWIPLLTGAGLLAIYYAALLLWKWVDWRELRGLMTLRA